MGRRPRNLSEFAGPAKQSGDELNFKYCPVCESDAWKLYVNPHTGKWMCFSSEHGSGGVVEIDDAGTEQGAELLRLLDDHGARDHQAEQAALPEWSVCSRRAREYLHSRGLDDPLIAKLGIVEMVHDPRVVVPFMERGQVVYWVARKLPHEPGPKYLACPGTKPLYVLRVPDCGSVAIVEGVFDAIRVYQAGMSAVALGGKTISQYQMAELRRLLADRSIQTCAVMLDQDAFSAALDLASRLPMHSPNVDFKYVPISAKDPADMSVDALVSTLSENGVLL